MMQKQNIINAIEFLKRVTLKGEEVDAFNAVKADLVKEYRLLEKSEAENPSEPKPEVVAQTTP